ncbi:TetR/AcrR family transcriptional regulator [Iamia sp. SCSIO 61187]|uniref:helix-turn-helix domain-containing protein n=1 Tax=Iamia sp. SCSIO 61187 TaxID=2722752 RepID=UPI001C634ED0|nr:TetR/AcrR family transcriptional regulator [Iamia sp. SCSIO 61187]QYG95070.1 TetR/AcrR family transcriptional regulator [Iamia sp. SCSIO 61187]
MTPVRSDRQQATVDALLDAALAHLRQRGPDGLTVRAVAEGAGLTHTTAYAYFSSRDHLVATLYWRQVRAEGDGAIDPAAPVGPRVTTALGGPGRVAAADPALARAGLTALVADEPAVGVVRDELGAHIVERIWAALGPDVGPLVVESLALAYTGAMLQASMGYLPFAAVADRVAALAEALTE